MQKLFPTIFSESQVDLLIIWHYATAEIRQRKKEEDRRRNHRAKYNGLPYYIGRP